MEFKIFGIYQDLIDIGYNTVVEQVSEDFIHKSLKDSERISQAIWHQQVLVVLPGDVEGFLPLISLTHPNEVVCTGQVYHGEELSFPALLMGCQDHVVTRWYR